MTTEQPARKRLLRLFQIKQSLVRPLRRPAIVHTPLGGCVAVGSYKSQDSPRLAWSNDSSPVAPLLHAPAQSREFNVFSQSEGTPILCEIYNTESRARPAAVCILYTLQYQEQDATSPRHIRTYMHKADIGLSVSPSRTYMIRRMSVMFAAPYYLM